MQGEATFAEFRTRSERYFRVRLGNARSAFVCCTTADALDAQGARTSVDLEGSPADRTE